MNRIEDRHLTPGDLLEWCEKAQRRNPAVFSKNGKYVTPTTVLEELQRVGRINTYPELCNFVRATRSGVQPPTLILVSVCVLLVFLTSSPLSVPIS